MRWYFLFTELEPPTLTEITTQTIFLQPGAAVLNCPCAPAASMKKHKFAYMLDTNFDLVCLLHYESELI
jgi:hypothetical protein